MLIVETAPACFGRQRSIVSLHATVGASDRWQKQLDHDTPGTSLPGSLHLCVQLDFWFAAKRGLTLQRRPGKILLLPRCTLRPWFAACPANLRMDLIFLQVFATIMCATHGQERKRQDVREREIQA